VSCAGLEDFLVFRREIVATMATRLPARKNWRHGKIGGAPPARAPPFRTDFPERSNGDRTYNEKEHNELLRNISDDRASRFFVALGQSQIRNQGVLETDPHLQDLPRALHERRSKRLLRILAF